MELADVPAPFRSMASYGLKTVLQDDALCAKVLRFDGIYNPESIGFFIAKFKKTQSMIVQQEQVKKQ